MQEQFRKFGLYNVDTKYLSALYDKDKEVRYSEQIDYNRKPYLGVVVLVEGRQYFIPLTSAKVKHIKWKNVGQAHYLIYEKVDESEIRANDIVRHTENGNTKILSALEINKMIPVPDDCFQRIDFNKIQDERYKSLLVKEFLFLQNVQDGILKKAKMIYDKQKQTGKIFQSYCNFALLENICDEWTAQ